MARYYNLIVLSVLLSSCAQVGTITGGAEDIYAPLPISEKIKPLNASINFVSNRIEIPFDEYFKLVNPSQTIRIVPPHTKIKASIKKKTLILEWEDTLELNTTYAIYLNKAVKDISEGNDSLMQYVFSTGNEIDTLTYGFKVIDAWSGAPISKCVVALYDADGNTIQSFAETNKSGDASLGYLKAETYKVIAFEDENGDLIRQDHERLGFPLHDRVKLDSSLYDSIPVRLFSPPAKVGFRNTSINGPGLISISGTRALKNYSISINQKTVPSELIKQISTDSLVVFQNTTNEENLEVIFSSELLTDTTEFRVSDKIKTSPVQLFCAKPQNNFAPSDTVSFFTNDLITSIDTSKINILDLSDSSQLNAYSVTFSYNNLLFDFDKTDKSDLLITLEKGAVSTLNSSSLKKEFNVSLNSERKYGALVLDLSYYESPVILNVLYNNKLIKKIPISNPSDVFKLSELSPGNYSFLVVRDMNSNQQWDVGDYNNLLQPEGVDSYSTVINVRANWDVELSLIPTK